MCDYGTYQAFFDYEHVYVYNRLPSHMVAERTDPRYPENLPVLRELIRQVEYVAIARNSEEDIRALLAETDIAYRAIGGNERYAVLILGGRQQGGPM